MKKINGHGLKQIKVEIELPEQSCYYVCMMILHNKGVCFL